MQPNLLNDLAKKAYQKKDYIQAAALFNQAADGYRQSQDPMLEAEMKNNQSVALLQGGEAQASLEAVKGTDLTFGKAGDLKRQGMALANQGAALQALKKKDEAARCYVDSAELLKRTGEMDLRAEVLKSMASLQISHGQFTDAVMSMQEGLIEVKQPSFKQKLLKKLLFLRLWR